jgi:hypothetical protein
MYVDTVSRDSGELYRAPTAVTSRNVGSARRLSKRIPRLVLTPEKLISLETEVQKHPAKNAGAYRLTSVPALTSSGQDQRISAQICMASAMLEYTPTHREPRRRPQRFGVVSEAASVLYSEMPTHPSRRPIENIHCVLKSV